MTSKYFSAIFLNLQLAYFILAIPIDNEITGDLNITCLESSVIVNFKTKNPFNGRVYIRGSYDVPTCNVDFSNNFQENAIMTLPFTDCNSHRERLFSPGRGIMHVATVIVSFHPLFITKVDKAYRIECVYKSIDFTVISLLDVSMIPTVQYNYVPPAPICTYDLKLGNLTGTDVRYVKVGDSVFHRWICDSDMYVLFVRSCFVSTSGRPTVQLVDNNGCSMDKHIMQNITYSRMLNEAWVETHAFTYQDVASLRFNCKLSLCLKSDSICTDEWSTVCSNFEGVTSSAATVKEQNRKHSKRNAPYLEQSVFTGNVIVSEFQMWANENEVGDYDKKNVSEKPKPYCVSFIVTIIIFVKCLFFALV